MKNTLRVERAIKNITQADLADAYRRIAPNYQYNRE
jgi:hypothetical protein